MMLETDKHTTIIEDLNNIAYESPYDSSLKIIDNRRAFAKTDTYKLLRKNELSNAEIYTMINNFVYQGKDVTSLITKSIKNLTVEKLIDIGGIDYLHQKLQMRHSSSNDLSFRLLNTVSLQNPSEELKMLLDYILQQPSMKKNRRDTGIALKTILDEMFINYYFSDNKMKENRVEEISAIEKHYYDIFKILNEDSLYEGEPSKVNRYIEPFNVDSKNIFMELREDNFKSFEKITIFMEKLRRMPFISIRFVKNYLSIHREFNSEEKLIIFYAVFCENNIIHTCDIEQELSYCENFKQNMNSNISFASLIKYATDGRMSNMNNFYNLITKKKFVSNERNKEIFDNYFSDVSMFSRSSDSLKLRAMIELKVEDGIVAHFVTEMADGYNTLYDITSEFQCDPKYPNTYPGPITLEVISALELKKLVRMYGKENSLHPDGSFTEELLYGRLQSHNGTLLITWKMANDPKLLKIMLSKLKNQSFKSNMLLKMFNSKNIGFKRLMSILEDVYRVTDQSLNANGLNNYNRVTYPFLSFSSSCLEFATDKEIYMYKHKIPTIDLLRAENTPKKVLDFFIKMLSVDNLDNHNKILIRESITNALMKNVKLTKEDKILIMNKLVKGNIIRNVVTPRLMSAEDDIKICFNVKGIEEITVADFNRVINE